MDMQSMTDTDIREHLAPAADHNFEEDEFTRLTLNRDLPEGTVWWKVDCPSCGGKHVIAWNGQVATTFECDSTGAKVNIEPGSDTDPDN